MKKRRVKFEPELEALAADWSPLFQLEMADKLERWARELRIGARIQLKDLFWMKPKPKLKYISPRRAALN